MPQRARFSRRVAGRLLRQPQQDRRRQPVAGWPSSNASITISTPPQLSVSYAPDVFGGTGAQVESPGGAGGEAQRFQLEAAYLTLTSNVVAAAVQEASLRDQIAATEEIIQIETRVARHPAHARWRSAQVAGADVAAQEAALAQAEATLPPLQKQLAQQRDLIAALAGRFPSRAAGRAHSTSPRCNCRRICR